MLSRGASNRLFATITKTLEVGVGRVSFSALGSGFGFFDFARVRFRVFEYFLGSPSGQARVKFFCIFQSILARSGKKLAIFLKKNLLRVTRVLQNFPQVSSGS